MRPERALFALLLRHRFGTIFFLFRCIARVKYPYGNFRDMNKRILKRYTCIFALAGAAFAQSDIGSDSLNGIITDATGGAVPGAKVPAHNTANGLVRNTQTSELGLYTFAGLPVGIYDLTVDAQGFKTTSRTAVQLMVGSATTLDVRLEVGTAQETVSVVADVSVVETTRTTAASNMTEKAVANLPVSGRNFIAFYLE